MNKRLQKKKNSLTVGMSRKGMREYIQVLNGANDVLLTAIEGIRNNKDMLERKITSMESNLYDIKNAHIHEVITLEKEKCKLRCQNKTLSDTVSEMNRSLQETYHENLEFQQQLIALRKRTLVERIMNKGVTN